MANQLSPDKEKIIYAEDKRVRDEIAADRIEQSEREGREISEAEFMRTLTLKYVNKRRRAQGKKPLTCDPKSAPGGRSSLIRRLNTA